MRTRIVSALALACLITTAGIAPACGGKTPPKVVIDVADRGAYQALRALDVAEEAAYHAKGPWPTPPQHQAVSQKFSAAYQAVIDVANLGVALPRGATLSAADLAVVGKLTTVVGDMAVLVGAPGAGHDIATAFQAFQAKATALVNSVKGN